MVSRVTILGGGPAGASAALAALAGGAAVTIVEKSRFPRHKVCGEFFSPETAGQLDQLGLWSVFREAGPAAIRRMSLNFGARSRVSPLPETAWGLSRYVFDALLLDRAKSSGANISPTADVAAINIQATGRRSAPAQRGQRLFGFKAHFQGPRTDAVELYFFPGGYLGLTPIEEGRTNVCGLAPESVLARHGFEYDGLLGAFPHLRERTLPLSRLTDWFSTGPLQFGQAFADAAGHFPAGDALSFVDPFTGSGLLAAVKTGALAGRMAARGQSLAEYLDECRNTLSRPFSAARILRRIVDRGWAERLSALVPGRLLFHVTRPR
jgi:flavin-dependent dehydrogenase